MPRLAAAKRFELEAFWRRHLEGCRRSDLNQREYCELHGLPLKRFRSLSSKVFDADSITGVIDSRYNSIK
jgi:hypothetical protein